VTKGEIQRIWGDAYSCTAYSKNSRDDVHEIGAFNRTPYCIEEQVSGDQHDLPHTERRFS
jgi:hypothetical protein